MAKATEPSSIAGFARVAAGLRRVEMWRGGVRLAYRVPPLSSAADRAGSEPTRRVRRCDSTGRRSPDPPAGGERSVRADRPLIADRSADRRPGWKPAICRPSSERGNRRRDNRRRGSPRHQRVARHWRQTACRTARSG
jgi:hypothetical protein